MDWVSLETRLLQKKSHAEITKDDYFVFPFYVFCVFKCTFATFFLMQSFQRGY